MEFARYQILKLFILLCTHSVFAQKQYLGFESNISFCMPRELSYSTINKFIRIYSDDYLDEYYIYKEENKAYELGITSQLKLLKHWNLFSKLKYSQYSFIGWHNSGDKLIQTPDGEDKIFIFDLDKYKFHTMKIGTGLNFHLSNRLYFQFIPFLNIPLTTTKFTAEGQYALRYTSPKTSNYRKEKNTEIQIQKFAYSYEAEMSAKIYKPIFIFCNYSKINDLYREKSNVDIKWNMRVLNLGIRATFL